MAGNNLIRLWPRAEVLQLRRENERLSVALKNATERAAEYLTRLDELRNQHCPACDILKQTLNFHVLAAGSKVGMFDGVGPTLPAAPPRPAADPNSTTQAPMRASKFARRQRADFLTQFVEQEARVPVVEEPETEAG